MIDKQKLESLIFEGIKKSYRDNFSFTGQINAIIKPESLIHINIAKQMMAFNDEVHDFGRPLLIKIEEPTVEFMTACVPFESNLDSIFDREVRDCHNSQRNGHIDIALYEHSKEDVFDEVPYAAIEVKDFIESRGELKADIIRNLEYLGVVDKKTGESRLNQTYLCCIHQHEGALSKTEKNAEIKRLYDGYNKYLKRFDFLNGNIKFRIEIQTVAEYLFDADDRFKPSEILEEKGAFAHHFIGVLIIFEK